MVKLVESSLALKLNQQDLVKYLGVYKVGQPVCVNVRVHVY